MSDLDRLDHLAELVDDALARRDLAAYRIARTAYAACLDQLQARVAVGRRKEALGLAELKLYMVWR